MTSPVDTSVKALWSNMAGATAGSNAIGGLIPVLDEVLVNGRGLLTASGVVIAGGVCTMTFPTAHSGEVGTVILVSGATSSTSINGEQRITAKAGNSISFATAEANASPSGTITAKIAALGWTKVFTGTNKAVYKPSDPAATGCYLRVDDTAATNARVSGFETMSDVDTGTGQFPTAVQLSGGMYWMKSTIWAVVGDGRGFYLMMGAATNPLYSVEFFGDIVSDKPGDAYACALFGASASQTGNSTNTQCISWVAGPTSNYHGYMPRSYTAVGGAIATGRYVAPWPNTASNYSGTGPGDHVYPNGADNSLRPAVQFVVSNNSVRGTLPGCYAFFQNGVNAAFNNLDTIAGAGDLAGRVLRMFRSGSPSGSSTNGTIACDVTGPWAR